MFGLLGGKRLIIFLVIAAVFVLFGRTAMANIQANNSAEASQASQQTYEVGTPTAAPIPKDALRLRIIANSDSAADQALKLEVRDVIVVKVAGLLKNAKNVNQAKAIVTAHVAQLQALAQQVVRAHGFRYDVKANVGMVPFPTKIYGDKVYPAGNYEALRFIIGKGQGQNWWCVLFPPLCFIDLADGDAVPNTAGFPDLPPIETLNVQTADGKSTKVQVRLLSADLGEELWKSIHGMFRG